MSANPHFITDPVMLRNKGCLGQGETDAEKLTAMLILARKENANWTLAEIRGYGGEFCDEVSATAITTWNDTTCTTANYDGHASH